MTDPTFKHNFHTHTFRCKHARGDVHDYCTYAVEHDMETIGFSDHTPLPDKRWIKSRMAREELDDYVKAVERGKREFPQLRILLGMECEYIPEFRSLYEDEFFGEYGFEYLVGGQHFYRNADGDWHSPYRSQMDAKNLRIYADSVVEMIESKLFAFIAHPDLFGNCRQNFDADVQAASTDILTAAKESAVGMEINALGCRKQARSKSSFPGYPWRPFWELAEHIGVETIVNADAHRPEDLQNLTEQAREIQDDFNLKPMNPSSIGIAN